MKKIIAIAFAALVLAGTNAFAQLSAGLGYINATEKSVYQNGDNDPVITKAPFNGLYAGVSYNLAVPGVNGLGLTPGIYASYLFSNRHVDGVSAFGYTILPGGTYKDSDISINVPIHVNYSVDIASDSKVFVYGGPMLQYALSNTTQYATDGSSDYNTTNNLQGNSATRAPFNLYVGAGLGAEFNKIKIILGYDMSLLNMDTRDNYTLGRSQIRLGVGYAL
ncbi:MAG: outer membrane beta-barrel protein [Bacteroidales bacterium]|nr:outer membrane beta-barrel protein [Bacteroidales bacterium]